VRIAISTWSARRAGGVETYLADLIPALLAAGHDALLWCEVDAPADREPIASSGMPVVCVSRLGPAGAVGGLVAWHPDVVYAHGLTDPLLEARLLDVAPTAFFVHSYYGTCISGGKTFTRPTVTPCSRVFGWRCLPRYFPCGCGGRSPRTMVRQYRLQSARLSNVSRCAAILTHSEHMVQEMGRHGLAAERLPYPAGGPGRPNARAEGRECARLLFAGRMDRLKGGLVLLQALPLVQAGLGRPVQLTFAGDGPDRARWERAAADARRATNGRIEFTGWAARDRLDRLMAESDLLVVPSLWPEPFGAIGPAAGCFGLPAAAFAVGGIPTWLTEGVNGALAPGRPPTARGLADAIVRCLADPEVHARLSRGAIEMAGRFSMSAHLVELLRVLDRVAGRAAESSSRSAAPARVRP
jgi:glycosyltransferase involved in cell wall biosynthesis